MQLIILAGASKGLGKDMAIEFATRGKTTITRLRSMHIELFLQGANLLILARTQTSLDTAREEILNARKSALQFVDTRSVDLTIPDEVFTLYLNLTAQGLSTLL
jgi:short-subunit dehydrogenase